MNYIFKIWKITPCMKIELQKNESRYFLTELSRKNMTIQRK